MADITFMTWTLDDFGPKKILPAGPLYNSGVYKLMAKIIDPDEYKGKSADIVGLIDMPVINAQIIFSGILAKLKRRDAKWTGKIIGPTGPMNNRRNYFIFYRNCPEFTYITHGLCNKDEAGKLLRFPTTTRRTGGLEPAYVVFKKGTEEKHFSFILYKAPPPNTRFTPLAGNTLGKIRELKKFSTSAAPTTFKDLSSVIIGGTFNVNPKDAARYVYYEQIPITTQSAQPVQTGGTGTTGTKTLRRRRMGRGQKRMLRHGQTQKQNYNLKRNSTTKKDCFYGNLKHETSTNLFSVEQIFTKSTLWTYEHFLKMDPKTIPDANALTENVYANLVIKKGLFVSGVEKGITNAVDNFRNYPEYYADSIRDYFIETDNPEVLQARALYSHINWMGSVCRRRKGKLGTQYDQYGNEMILPDCFSFYRNYISSSLPLYFKVNSSGI